MILRKGDTITVNETTDNWWLGKRGDTKGYIPSNFVKIHRVECPVTSGNLTGWSRIRATIWSLK